MKNTFQDYHDNPLHFLCICLLDKGRKNQNFLSPVTTITPLRIMLIKEEDREW